jgi:hypothetical protein
MKIFIHILISTVVCSVAFPAHARASASNPNVSDHGLEKAKIDWPTFMRQHDMTFDKLPGSWTEAPHFGNAMVGSMLYQEANTITLQVFRADVQDHRDDTWGWTAYSRPRLLIGQSLSGRGGVARGT